MDLCGVDYLGHGSAEWETANVSSEGFSRGVELGFGPGRFKWEDRPRGDGPERRFANVVHLRSYQHNRLLRVRCYAPNDELPVVASVTDIWPGANWFERAGLVLFGVIYENKKEKKSILRD